MFEFLLTNNNTGNPTVMTILITVIFSFFLSSLLVITYELTTKTLQRPLHFMQAMVLISIVSATVMQAIGDSLARGLGMLGALAIIRFRTRLDNPRNMAFMFGAIATGIACGVFGFTIALVGTIGFCLAAFIVRFSPLSQHNNLVGRLRIEIQKETGQEKEFQKILEKYCRYYELEQIRLLNTKKTEKILDEDGNVVEEISKDHLKELNYLIQLRSNDKLNDFTRAIEALTELGEIRLRFDRVGVEL